MPSAIEHGHCHFALIVQFEDAPRVLGSVARRLDLEPLLGNDLRLARAAGLVLVGARAAACPDLTSWVTTCRQERVAAPLVAVVDSASSPAVIELYRAGIDGVFLADATDHELAAAIRALGPRPASLPLTLPSASPAPQRQTDVAPATSGLLLDQRQLALIAGDTSIQLTATEFEILRHLYQQAGKWVRSREILQAALGTCHLNDTSLVRVHMHHIRKKLGPLGKLIESRRQLGYRLCLAAPLTSCERIPEPAGYVRSTG